MSKVMCRKIDWSKWKRKTIAQQVDELHEVLEILKTEKSRVMRRGLTLEIKSRALWLYSGVWFPKEFGGRR